MSKKNKLEIPVFKLDKKNKRACDIAKKVQFLDIESSLVDARVFRTGLQTINANQLSNTTKILTVAGGSMYDLAFKGEKGIWGFSNHQSSTFKKDPLDDTEVLEKVWRKLDEADVVVAHNSRFDKGHLMGRFLELGWALPSRFALVCTYRSLHGYDLTSKKLDELSQTLVGTEKIHTDFSLWNRCSDGEVSAFKEMLRYNKGDIYETMFKLYMRTCQYYPQKSVDLTDHSLPLAQCRVTGRLLDELEDVHTNHSTGKQYQLYHNPENNLYYVDRYCVGSKKAGIGKVKHHM